MTREEAIKGLKVLRRDFSGYKPNEEMFDMAIKALEQEPCGDEYIKVPKNALKYRTAEMVAYNAEWLKNHFDIERAVICGTQDPCVDSIIEWKKDFKGYVNSLSMPRDDYNGIMEYIDELPVTPRQAPCEEREKGECPFYAE